MSNSIKIIYEATTSNRLDKFLTTYFEAQKYSRSYFQNLIQNQKITVNNLAVTNNYILKLHDEITVIFEDKAPNDTIVPVKHDLDIIYEDDDLIIINKPNNLVVHAGAGNHEFTLVNVLAYYFQQLSQVDQNRPGIVHRLDKQTSGLLIIAKNDWTQHQLTAMIQERKIKRTYFALVHGKMESATGTIKAPIGRNKNMRTKMMVVASGKAAVTHFTVIEEFKDFTLLECNLETGRTHQIRVHLQWINHPVYNDPIYSDFPVENVTDGQYLHAAALMFNHPRTNETLHFNAPLPAFFAAKLKLLRKAETKHERQ